VKKLLRIPLPIVALQAARRALWERDTANRGRAANTE
jgi:hypothetical protein